MIAINKGISQGDRIELGELREVTVESNTHGIRLTALSSDDTEEYIVVAKTDVQDGQKMNIHVDAKPLGFASGMGINSAAYWYALPTGLYGGGAD